MTDQPYPDKWGNFMTGWAPLLDAEGRQYGALGVDVDAEVYFTLLQRARHWALLGLLPATLLIALLTLGFHRLRTRYLSAAREAVRAGRALAGERQRLGNIVEEIHIGTWETSIDERGVHVSQVDARWAAMLGRQADDLNPLHADTFCPLLVHPEDVCIIESVIPNALATQDKLLEFDVRLRHADGHWVWTRDARQGHRARRAGKARRMVGTQSTSAHDKAIEYALTESESHLRALFELSPIGICLSELPSGRFLQVNDAMLAPHRLHARRAARG